MNIFGEGEFAVPVDDQEWLLRMVEEAHRPFIARPYAGDISAEWARRWSKAQPKPNPENSVAAKYSTNVDAAVNAMKVTYSGRGRTLNGPEPKVFPLDKCAEAILARWPGIGLDKPEQAWNAKPEIAELMKLRKELQSQRELAASDSLKSGGVMATQWR